MTEEKIIEKAIAKAKKNGWIDTDGKGSYLDKDISGVIVGMWHINRIIFSHDFAKAFWGSGQYQAQTKLEEKVNQYKLIKPLYLKAWQFYLQQMVLEKEPLKYLEKFLNK